MMIRHFRSEDYDVYKPPAADMTIEQMKKFAIAQAMRRAAFAMEMEMARGDVGMPTSIRVEVCQNDWDLYAILHFEGGEIVNSNDSLSGGDTPSKATGG